MWMQWTKLRQRWIYQERKCKGLNQRELGKKYEDLAAAYLKDKGMQIIYQNYRCRQGEVDLVGIHENCLVFVEVKYRKSNRQGMPEEAVGVRKQMKICRTSDYFRVSHGRYSAMQVRYDVISVINDEITWYQNAFAYVGTHGRMNY